MGKRQAYTRIMEIEKSVKDLVTDYLNMKKVQGVTKFTLEIQEGIFKRFFRRVPDGGTDVKKWKHEIQLYLVENKSAYFNKQLDALRQLFKFCVEEGILDSNPCNGITYKKPVSRIVEHGEDTLKKLLVLPDKTTFSGLRDYTFILLVLDTGIRPYEALQLKTTDVMFYERYVHVREEVAKTRQARFLPLSVPTVQALKKIIDIRPKEWDKNGFILCNHFGERMDTHSLQGRFRDYSDRLGTKITTYMLRHSFALYFIRNNGDPFTLQRIMGHTRLDQTKEYVSLAKTDITKGHEKASPLNNLLSQNKKIIKKIKK